MKPLSLKSAFQLSALVIVAALSLGVSSCEKVATAFDPYEITINLGETVISGEGKISVTFDDVVEDSRCPTDVVCVWEGNALVKLNLLLDGIQTEVELNSSLEPNVVDLNGVQIKYVSLTPQPHSQQEIDPSNYALTLEISSL